MMNQSLTTILCSFLRPMGESWQENITLWHISVKVQAQ